MSVKVYRHRTAQPDEYVGRLDPDTGKAYETRFGPDRYIGRVDLSTGKVYESRMGPDKYIGRVKLESGEIYRHRLGPDEYIGRVNPNGKLFCHVPLGRDEYLGKVVEMHNLALGGAALLLFFATEAEPTPRPSQTDPKAREALDEEPTSVKSPPSKASSENDG